MKNNIWEGIYRSFKELPVLGDGFQSDQWIIDSRRKMIDLLKEDKSSIFSLRNVEPFLPVVVALIDNGKKDIKILDFGGNLGITYSQLRSSAISRKIEYHIVENHRVCEEGKKLFSLDKSIQFHDSLPENLGYVDIVHIHSVLQYVQDWKSKIKQLMAYRPKYFLLVNLSAGNIPTYATVQNYYDSKLPYWFLNINEVIDIFRAEGFELLFKSTYHATILGREQEIPQDNFPEEYRLGNACNLLFRRKDD